MLTKNKQVLFYGVALAILVSLLKWLEMQFIITNHGLQLYVGLIALIFTGLGVWLTFNLRQPKVAQLFVNVLIAPKAFSINIKELQRLNLSKRELEVLQLMAQGLSNKEISERLFVSVNTVKTHATQVFEKMDVKRRTQAVEVAQRLSIIP